MNLTQPVELVQGEERHIGTIGSVKRTVYVGTTSEGETIYEYEFKILVTIGEGLTA